MILSDHAGTCVIYSIGIETETENNSMSKRVETASCITHRRILTAYRIENTRRSLARDKEYREGDQSTSANYYHAGESSSLMAAAVEAMLMMLVVVHCSTLLKRGALRAYLSFFWVPSGPSVACHLALYCTLCTYTARQLIRDRDHSHLLQS